MNNEELRRYYDFFNGLQKLLKTEGESVSVPVGFLSGFGFKTSMAADVFSAVMKEVGKIPPEEVKGIRGFLRDSWLWFKKNHSPSTEEDWERAIESADRLARESPFKSGDWMRGVSGKYWKDGGTLIVLSMMEEIEKLYKARSQNVRV